MSGRVLLTTHFIGKFAELVALISYFHEVAESSQIYQAPCVEIHIIANHFLEYVGGESWDCLMTRRISKEV